MPVTQWSIALLREHILTLDIVTSESSVQRILRGAMLQPHRQKMWLTSHDDEFKQKRDDVLRLYDETPDDEHIICVDEKTGIQALERKYPDIVMEPGTPVRREFEYVRHGTLALMGAYDVRRGKIFGFMSEDTKAPTFIDLLDLIDECYPEGCGHIVCDNVATHDTDDVVEWFEEHPRWKRHFTPKHASWLNQIECAFSILERRVLARGSFASKDELREKVYEYLRWHNTIDRPFEWTYRPRSSAKIGRTSDGRH